MIPRSLGLLRACLVCRPFLVSGLDPPMRWGGQRENHCERSTQHGHEDQAEATANPRCARLNSEGNVWQVEHPDCCRHPCQVFRAVACPAYAGDCEAKCPRCQIGQIHR